jgi:SSS family solute:Na+ symporter
MQLHVLDLAVLALYAAVVLGMGFTFARRNTSTEEYFLGGRAFPGWVIGLSIVGTAISSITFLSMPADAFKTTWTRFLPYVCMPLAAVLAGWVIVPFFRRGRTTSAYEYLEARFGPSIRVYGAATYIAAQLLRLSLVLYLVALLIHELTGLEVETCILAAGVFTGLYTVVGGIDAVIWTDVLQTLILVTGSLLCLGTIVAELPGGLAQIFEIAAAHHKFSLGSFVDGELVPIGWGLDFGAKTVPLMLLMSASFFLTEYTTAQHFVQRYCAARSLREARKSLAWAVAVAIPTWLFYMFLGTALFALFTVYPDPEVAAMLDGSKRAEQIVPYFVLTHLPAGVAGLVIAAALAAGMSSLDSSLNAISTVGVVDVYRRHLAKDRDDRHYLRAARWITAAATAAMIAGATGLLRAEGPTLQDVSIKLTSLLGGGILAIYAIGFCTRVGDARSVWGGVVCTVAFTAWTMGLFPSAWSVPFDTYYTAAIGNAVMFVVGYGLATLLPKRPRPLAGLTLWSRAG